MSIRTAAAVLLVACAACATARIAAPALEPLRGEAEVRVYALPLPRDAERLSFTVEAVSLLHDGGEVPLRVGPAEHAVDGRAAQRLLASGRVPPGSYHALSLRIASAALAAAGERPRLLVGAEPLRVEVDVRVGAGSAAVVWVSLEPGAVRDGHAFTPRFLARVPPQTPPQQALYCTDAGSASVTVMERRPRRVSATVPVGADPRGIALDVAAARAYVALSRDDEIQVIDVAAGAPVGRIQLSPGDGPGELGLAADRTLVVVNERSRTVAFVDTTAMMEVGRAPAGEGAGALLVDRSGRRAYVANRGAGTVTVLDVQKRAVLGTIATDPEPLRVQLNRDGDRLYVLHRGSAHLGVFAIPSLAPVAHPYVGLGGATLKVDARTDLLYLGRADVPWIDVYDPLALQRMDRFEIPGPASYLAIDDAENALLVLVPGRGTLAVVDLTSRRVLVEVPAGERPYLFTLAGERP
jgi:YVTN family beta-propeller protein